MQFRRQNIRLPGHNYRGRGQFFITLCCEHRRQVFADGHRARWLVDHLRKEAEGRRFGVHAFCVMPDHLHALVEGLDTASDLLLFVKTLKQKTAFLHQREFHERLWQKKFYDYILRPQDLPDRVAWYIWMNPVRKGLCAQPGDYLYSGSFTIEWRKTTPPREPWVPAWKKERYARLKAAAT